jgi:hypothetical protein
MTQPYDPVPDLAAVLAGLQVPRSMMGGRTLGAALEPFDRLRKGLGLFGWPDAAEHEERLREALRQPPDTDPGPPEPVPDQCPGCHAQRINGLIAHTDLSCPEMWKAGGPAER